MSAVFMCENHRIWLTDHPKQALRYCVSASESGWLLYEQSLWEDALPFMGCAHETAEIIMSARVIEELSAVDNFIFTLSGLIQLLIQMKRIELAKNIYKIALARLKIECEISSKGQGYIKARLRDLTQEYTSFQRGIVKVSYVQQAELTDVGLSKGSISVAENRSPIYH